MSRPGSFGSLAGSGPAAGTRDPVGQTDPRGSEDRVDITLRILFIWCSIVLPMGKRKTGKIPEISGF